MMIPFDGLVERFKIKARGVLHIGSNTAQEALDYKKHGIDKVIWIEAIPEVYAKMLDYLHSVGCLDENVTTINACISDEQGKEVEFNISNNDAQSSSFLELGVHKEIHPSVFYTHQVKMTTARIDNIFTTGNLVGYDLLNIDTQGSELQVLKGMGDLLYYFKYAIIEINMRATYIGGALVGEVDEYMERFNFVRAETGKWVAGTWTDGFYIKKDML
jgi:FkbM family methyltransferase